MRSPRRRGFTETKRKQNLNQGNKSEIRKKTIAKEPKKEEQVK